MAFVALGAALGVGIGLVMLLPYLDVGHWAENAATRTGKRLGWGLALVVAGAVVGFGAVTSSPGTGQCALQGCNSPYTGSTVTLPSNNAGWDQGP
jgi:hypothetical protein